MTLDHPWTTAPAPADVVNVAPGIGWLRMPLPFQLNHINLWLLEDGDGWTIVDTGVGLDDTRALWERIFATCLDGRPVRRVLVTHFHPDHIGNAGWLTARWKTELWCTQAEWLYAQFAWRSRGAADFEPRLAHFRRHGCGPGNHYPSLVPEVASEFRRIREGDSITIGRRAFRVLVALGHAPEHACLWDEAGRVLIAGDQVLPKITTNVSVWSSSPGSIRSGSISTHSTASSRCRPTRWCCPRTAYRSAVCTRGSASCATITRRVWARPLMRLWRLVARPSWCPCSSDASSTAIS